jgi:osmotically inducible protein OsmC
MIKRKATSVWNGSGKDGQGTLTTQSGTLHDTPYSFNMRFGEGAGTNPEELIAAAHAGCFNMALSFMLSGEGFVPEALNTTATVTVENDGSGWSVTMVHLDLKAKIADISLDTFQEIAERAKAGCPISRVLDTVIMMDATLM